MYMQIRKDKNRLTMMKYNIYKITKEIQIKGEDKSNESLIKGQDKSTKTTCLIIEGEG